MFEDLSQKNVLVTGSSAGLGLHFARVLAAKGANVVLGARREGELAKACAEIVAGGGRASFVALDVRDSASIEAAIGLMKGIDILVNNAGISASASAIDITEEEWDRVVDINLKGAFLTAQAAARRMKADGHGGAIVNIASILGLRVAGNLASYAASKAAVVHLTKALALEWARYGIRVNALCPGYIETDINRDFFATAAGEALVKRIPQRRLGRQEDLDAPLLLFCSSAGGYVTGASLAVDGGHLVTSL